MLPVTIKPTATGRQRVGSWGSSSGSGGSWGSRSGGGSSSGGGGSNSSGSAGSSLPGGWGKGAASQSESSGWWSPLSSDGGGSISRPPRRVFLEAAGLVTFAAVFLLTTCLQHRPPGGLSGSPPFTEGRRRQQSRQEWGAGRDLFESGASAGGFTEAETPLLFGSRSAGGVSYYSKISVAPLAQVGVRTLDSWRRAAAAAAAAPSGLSAADGGPRAAGRPSAGGEAFHHPFPGNEYRIFSLPLTDASPRCQLSKICDGDHSCGPDGLGCVVDVAARQAKVREAIRWSWQGYR
jgi:hypothetical protein